MDKTFEPVIGRHYGQTKVLSGPFSNNGRYWNCQCECGVESVKTITSIRHAMETGRGGCNACSSKKHGYGSSRNPTYSRYQAMKARCLNPLNKSYSDYGGRGIKICDSWLNSFENFLADMGEVPGPEYTNERNNTNGDYTPENCRWATKLEQANNTRANNPVTVQGMTFPSLTEACRHHGLNADTVKVRITTYKWSVDRAFSEPIDISKRKKK